jgi:hypothetical protein
VRLLKPVDPYDENDWPPQFAWLQDWLQKCGQAFRTAVFEQGHGFYVRVSAAKKHDGEHVSSWTLCAT